MQTTIPTTANQTTTAPAPMISPLARAALDNGVSFEDVQAYVSGRGGGHRDASAVYELAILLGDVPGGNTFASALADGALDAALTRSHAAAQRGHISSSVPFWFGVLP